MIRVVGVRFRNNGRIYYFDPGELEIVPGDGVIVETARGARVWRRARAPLPRWRRSRSCSRSSRSCA